MPPAARDGGRERAWPSPASPACQGVEQRGGGGDRGEGQEAGVEAEELDEISGHEVAQPGADAGRRGERRPA